MRQLHARRIDIILIATAVALLLPTCWYRYGIDQALYHYVGAGWLHGRVPYRDAFDIKPPGIYAIYAFAIALLGPGQASVRLLELLGIVATGIVIARTVGEEAPDGLAGASALALAAWYSTLFGFWDTGQAELWQSIFVVASYSALVSRRDDATTRIVSGAFSSLALLTKPTVALAVAVLAVRALVMPRAGSRASGRRLAELSLGAAVPLVLTGAYFWCVGAGPELREWVGYLLHYAGAPVDPDWARWTGPEQLLVRSGIFIAGFVAASVWRADRWTAALAVGTALGIVVQRRYFSYHGACLGPVLALAAAPAMAKLLANARAKVVVASSMTLAAGAFFVSPPWTGNEMMNYREYVLHAWWPYARGRTETAAFEGIFGGPFGYRYADQVAVAALVNGRHPARTDGLQVRGFDPTIYVLTGLYSPSRFLMEAPVQDPYLLQYAPGWAAEHERALGGDTAPRFVVTQVGAEADIAGLLGAGFELLGSRARYVVLERDLQQERMTEAEVNEALERRTFEGLFLGGAHGDATVAPDGSFSVRMGDRTSPGRWRVQSDGTLCVRSETGSGETCGAVYRRGRDFSVFESSGQEMATVRATASTR